MARTNNLTNFLSDVSSAIKQKTGDSSSIPAADFDTKILSIPAQGTYQEKQLNITQNGNFNLLPDSGYDALSNVQLSVDVSGSPMDPTTATAEDVLYPETFYSNGQKLVGEIVPEYKDVSVSINNRLYENGLDNSANVICSNKEGYIVQTNGTTVYLYRNGEQLAVFTGVLASNNCHSMTVSDVYTQDDNIDMVLFYPYGGYTGVPTCKYYSIRYINSEWSFVELTTSFDITSGSYFSNRAYGLSAKFVTTEFGKHMVLIGGGNATQLRAVKMIYTPFTAESVTFEWCSLYYQYDAWGGNVSERNLLQLDAFTVENGNVIINYNDYSYKAMLIVNSTMSTILYQNYYSNRASHNYVNSKYLFTETRYVDIKYANNIITVSLCDKNSDEVLDTLQIGRACTNVISNYDENGGFYISTQYSGDYIIYMLSLTNDELELINTYSYGYSTLDRLSAKMVVSNYGCRVFPCTSRILEFYNGNTNKKLISLRRNQENFRLLDPLVITTPSQVLQDYKFYNGQGLQTGTMPNNGTLNYTPSDAAQFIPAGYTSGGTVNAADITTLNDYKVCDAIADSILGGTLPYVELEYIQSTGTQYINTLFNTQNGFVAEIKLEFTSNVTQQYIIGNMVNNVRCYLGVYNNRITVGANSDNWATTNPVVNTVYIMKASTVNQNIYLDINNTREVTSSATYTPPNGDCLLFKVNNLSLTSFIGKMYYCKIWDNNGQLVRDLIPVQKKLDNVVCLYDKISKTYFENAGTDTFIAGPEKEEV